MQTYDYTDRGAYLALGMMFGIAAGIGAGLLLAPRSGAETRQKIKSQAAEAKRRTQAQLAIQREKATQKLTRAMEISKEMAEKSKEGAKDAASKA